MILLVIILAIGGCILGIGSGLSYYVWDDYKTGHSKETNKLFDGE